jgi:beta-mannosidase
MYLQSLDGDWRVSKVGTDDWYPAVVPGCIHTDMMASEVIPDPFVGDNEQKVGWVAETDWIYKRDFQPDADLLACERVFLQCDGLDTLANIRINETEVARTDNMHRRYEFDVTEALRPGVNTIEVQFDSPVEWVQSMIAVAPLVISPSDSIPGSPLLRKAMYQWGWDWAPKLPTSGIWRSIRLVGHSIGGIADVSVHQLHGRTRVELSVRAAIERLSTNAELTVRARLTSPNGTILEESETVPADSSEALLDFLIDDPELWWPNGYGAQPLYILDVYLIPSLPANSSRPPSHQSPGPNPIALSRPGERRAVSKGHNSSFRLGLRTIELVREPDEWGRSFFFRVNGVPIFCKGANWVPADQFPSRVSEDRYRDLISSAALANMNMLRVWGGGIYEDDTFYRLCDEHGILVWQDFMFACAFYPSDDRFLDNIRQEAIDNIRRVRHHACLALWCGNNEMEWFLADKWETHSAERRSAYTKIFHEMLPQLCAQEDIDTPYWPSSPATETPFDNPNSETEGDGHYWDVWHGKEPFTAYRERYYRFMSEFGFESLPPMATVKTFADPKEWNMVSYTMEQHQKNSAGNALILHYIAQQFRIPTTFPMTVYVSEILQAEAMRYGVEHWRRNRNANRCMGALYWQYNDCWPVSSWSGIDYFNRWKALHYFAKRFYAPVLLSAEESGSSVKLHVANDLQQPFQCEIRWSLETLDGKVMTDGIFCAEAPPASDTCIADLNFAEQITDDNRRSMVFVYTLRAHNKRISTGIATFVPNKHLDLPDPCISHEVEHLDDEIRISLVAHNTARFVMLDIPGHDVRFSDNFFDLPAGRLITVSLQTSTGLTAEEIEKSLQVISLRDSYG